MIDVKTDQLSLSLEDAATLRRFIGLPNNAKLTVIFSIESDNVRT